MADWLQRHRPAVMTPGIVHGNYHLGDLLFDTGGPDLAAVLEWEHAGAGDPLVDLGYLAATWPDGTGLDTLAGLPR